MKSVDWARQRVRMMQISVRHVQGQLRMRSFVCFFPSELNTSWSGAVSLSRAGCLKERVRETERDRERGRKRKKEWKHVWACVCLYVCVEQQNSSETFTWAVDKRWKTDTRRRGTREVIAWRCMSPCLKLELQQVLATGQQKRRKKKENKRERKKEKRKAGMMRHGTGKDSRNAEVCLWD